MRPHRVALLLLSLALSACASAPGPSLVPVPANSPPTAAPGAPRLLVRLNVGAGPYGIGRHTADYLSDGTVVRWTVVGSVCQLAQPCGTMERNTLTTTGLAGLHSLLDKDADLLANPITVIPQRSPGLPLRGGYQVDTFVLERLDGSRYTVNAPNSSFRSADPSAPDPATWVPDPAIARLNALAAALIDPVTLVGSAGLAHAAWEAYQPPEVAIFIEFSKFPLVHPTPMIGLDRSIVGMPFEPPDYPDIGQIGWPFAGGAETFGTAFDASGTFWAHGEGATFRCAFLPNADALAAIASLPRSIGTWIAPGDVTSGVTWEGSPLRLSQTTVLSLRAVALLPEDAGATCVDALSY
jgi:hypothetical protein